MSASYRAIQWNRHKRMYDAFIAVGIVVCIGVFFIAGKLLYPAPGNIGDEILLLRSLGITAFLLLHVILAIGPLARLNQRFAPLLYNRRHLGVVMFLLALAHVIISLGYYGGFGIHSPIVAIFGRDHAWYPLSEIPFEYFGLAALINLFLMAATSHDFWLANLSARTWKTLHLLVYSAYLMIVAHIAFGVMQDQHSLLVPILLGCSAAALTILHVAAARRTLTQHPMLPPTQLDPNWIDIGDISEIPESRALTVCLAGRERIAVFKHDGTLSAVSNVCAHQGGPLGEGKIVDGCITCPWHGYQYLPHNGQSPPPFTEKLPTYQLRIEGTRLFVNPVPSPPGTHITPVKP